MSCNSCRQCPANNYPYVIKSGDTLNKMAQKLGVSVSRILAANPGVNPYRLRIGQVLCIPACLQNQTVRIIQSGDTLYKIAQAYNVSVASIISANPNINPNYLSIGQHICIPVDPIIEQIRGMTLQEKIGQMVIVGLNGYAVDDYTRSMVNNYHVGGFILFGYNVESTSQLLALINTLKSINSKNKIPLFMSVDEEGGRVSRMPGEFKNLPTNKAIGDVDNEGLSYRIGSVIAEQIKAFGFNMDFAPVLDINSNPNNPVIGDRAFGSNAEVVTKLGVQTMKGIQAGGIISVVKHFPGHGDTSVDSHIGLPSVNNDLSRLKSFELIPFDEAIKNKADAVMVAHILLNKIDPNYPASFSKIIITDILRKQLNFNGVVITDDMTMGAIIKNYAIGNAAVRAVNAGVDIVLVCRGYDNETAVFNALINAVKNGIIPKARIDESVYRILKLKRKYNLADNMIASVDVNKINNDISAVLNSF